MFRLGYNTNGLSHHRLGDALELLAELGYQAVALTPDPGHLDPYHLDEAELREIRLRARDLGLELCVETGSRFLLDPRRKHFPTLLETEASDRARRVDFLVRCLDLATELGAGVVSCWSGSAPDGVHADSGDVEPIWDRLCAGLGEVLRQARERGVRLAFEPEPGMFVERPGQYDQLIARLGSEGEELGLCLDVGHLLCTGDLPVEDSIARWAPRLAMVHLDDIRDGVHEHLMFGQGDLDLPATLAALQASGYDGLCCVELSRDAHRGAEAAREAISRLRAALQRA